MASNAGGKRAGAGRPKGARNAVNREMEELLKARMAELGYEDYDPVVCMAEIAQDTSNSIELRFKAHAEVAQYVRAKKRFEEPAASEQKVEEKLSPEAKKARIQEILTRLGIEYPSM